MSVRLNSVNACKKRYYHILCTKKQRTRKLSRTTNVLLLLLLEQQESPLNTKTSSFKDECIYFILSVTCVNIRIHIYIHIYIIIELRDCVETCISCIGS